MNNVIDRRRARVRAAAALLAALLAAAGCATVKEAAVGLPPDEGIRRSLIIDPGYQPLSRSLEAAEAVAADSAHRGHRLSVRVVDGGNASSLRHVDLTAANGGDLRREARNRPGRDEEAERNTAAVAAAIRSGLDDFAYSGSGADLLGAVERVASSRPAPDQVVLITGGGVHQTAEANLVADYRRVDELAAAIPPLQALEVQLVIIGAGDFAGARTTPTAEFTDAVTRLWEAACEMWQVRRCVLASGTDVLETLEG